MRRSTLVAALAAAVPTLLAVGCGSEDPSGSGDGASVVVSTGIWGDVVGQIAGDCADVEVLIPPGVDPHGFELSAQGAASLREADLVLINGLGLEEQIEGAIESAEADGVVVAAIADDLDPLPFAEEDDGEEDEDEHGHDGDDPHVWQDPRRVAAAVPLIAEQLAEHTSCDAAALDARAEAYVESLGALDADLEAELAAVPPQARRLVTNHDAFGYFADRFDFEIVGTVIPSGTTLAEPSSAELAALADTLVATGADAIFAETTHSTELADALADETGRPIEVVELYSDALGEEGSGADTYEGMMRTNVERIRGALAP